MNGATIDGVDLMFSVSTKGQGERLEVTVEVERPPTKEELVKWLEALEVEIDRAEEGPTMVGEYKEGYMYGLLYAKNLLQVTMGG